MLAVAHVRGGGQLGPGWHEAGRGAEAKAAAGAADLRACAEALVAAGVAGSASSLALECSSAGEWSGALNADDPSDVSMAMMRRAERFPSHSLPAAAAWRLKAPGSRRRSCFSPGHLAAVAGGRARH